MAAPSISSVKSPSIPVSDFGSPQIPIPSSAQKADAVASEAMEGKASSPSQKSPREIGPRVTPASGPPNLTPFLSKLIPGEAPEKQIAGIEEKFKQLMEATLSKIESGQAVDQKDGQKIKWSTELYQVAQKLFHEATLQEAALEKTFQDNHFEGAQRTANLWSFVQTKQLEIQKQMLELQRDQEKHKADLTLGQEKLQLEKQAQEFRQKIETMQVAAELRQKEWDFLLLLQKSKGTQSFPELPTAAFLHQTAQAGSSWMVDTICNAGLSLDAINDKGNTPLACAVLAGKRENAERLAAKTKWRGFKNNKGETLLHLAVRSGNMKMVEWVYALDKKSLAVRDSDEKTALYIAIEENSIEIAKWLRSQKASLTVRNKEGKSPLHIAFNHDDLTLASWLIEEDPAIVKAKDSDGCSAVTPAIRRGELKLAEKMLEKGASFDPKNRHNKELLSSAAAEGNVDSIRWLVVKGVFVDAEDLKESTPLLRAFMEGQFEAAQVLVELGAEKVVPIPGKIEFNGKRFAPETLLHAAVFAKQTIEIIDWLRDSHKVDLETINSQGETALQVAVANGQLIVARSLVAQEAKIGGTLLLRAVQSGSLEMVQWVYAQEDKHEDKASFQLAVSCEYLEIAKFLHQKNPHLIERTIVFSWAAKGNSKEMLSWLLSFSSVDINFLDTSEPYCQTALQTAVFAHNLVGGTLLVEAEAWTHIAQTQGESLLHIAIEGENFSAPFFEWLVGLPGVGIEAKNRDGHTPLQKAMLKGREQAAAFLVTAKKADTTVVSAAGETLLHLAVLSGRLECVVYAFSICRQHLNTGDSKKRTSLCLAFEHKFLQIAHFLIQQGATLQTKKGGWNNQELFCYAAQKGFSDVMYWLFDNMEELYRGTAFDIVGPAFCHAVKGEQIEIAKDLFVKYLQTKFFDQFGPDAMCNLLCELLEKSKDPIETVEWLFIVYSFPKLDRKSAHNDLWLNISPLHIALRNGLLRVAQLLVRKGANITFLCEMGKECSNVKLQEPLEFAIQSGSTDLIQWFFAECNIDLGKRQTFLKVLKLIVKYGSLPVLEWFLAQPITSHHENINNPMASYCVHFNQLEMAKFCKRRGGHFPWLTREWVKVRGSAPMLDLILPESRVIADPVTTTGFDETDLQLAVYNQCAEHAKLLAQRGSRLTVIDSHKRNLLHIALISGENLSLELFEWLLTKREVDIEGKDEDDQTPLQTAFIHSRRGKNRDAVILLLLRRNAKTDVIAHGGRNLLHLALHSTHQTLEYVQIFNLLVQKMGEIKAFGKSTDGSTLIHYAAISGYIHALEWAYRYCPNDINTADNEGRTPLSQVGDKNVQAWLKSKGAT